MRALLLLFTFISPAITEQAVPADAPPEHHRPMTLQEQVMAQDKKIDAIQRQIAALNSKEKLSKQAFIDMWIQHANLGFATIDRDDASTEMGQNLKQQNNEIEMLRRYRNAVVYSTQVTKDQAALGQGWPPEKIWQWLHSAQVTLYQETRGQNPDPGPERPTGQAANSSPPTPTQPASSSQPEPTIQFGWSGNTPIQHH